MWVGRPEAEPLGQQGKSTAKRKLLKEVLILTQCLATQSLSYTLGNFSVFCLLIRQSFSPERMVENIEKALKKLL
ncbi:hypothetical protein [Corynebacterium occultum]|uniref:hypothetical protein n=1 Tax=Corynebacterium occultum TaxID=2675219 RepID=UPI0012E2E64B|nr:hypothetical protein [Corynebacterium occultum]